MKVLVIGKGGREHAIAWKLSESPSVTRLFVAPGNVGMRELATCVPIDEMDIEALVTFAKEERIDLTIVGPEAPLLAGVVDAFQKEDLRVFGPTKEAAFIEGSKSYAKYIMEKYDIPTAKSATFENATDAINYIDKHGAPIVIKADGLAAGKGVVVAMTKEEALEAVHEMMVESKFGEASSQVVIEEYLEGEEFSLMAFVNGEAVYPMVIAQDHKRAFDGDQGPNTGGMGAYSPVPQIAENVVKESIKTILYPTASGLVKEGRSFCGILYAGLMLTKDGPKVIEFNARFGDPETQVVLPRLENDLAEVIVNVLDKKEMELKWSDKHVLGVVMAAKGYPNEYEKGYEITGLSDIDCYVFHAGTEEKDGKTVTNGGRVLLVAAEGEELVKAQQKAYEQLEKVQCDNLFNRTDIGNKAIQHAFS